MPALLVLLAAVLFGTTGTAKALGPDGVSSLATGSARLAIGGLALALIAGLLHRRAHPRNAETLMPMPSVGSARTWLVIVVGALGVLAYQPLFFVGTTANGVAVGTIVALGSAPVLTGVLDWLIAGRFPGRRWTVATGLALIGVLLLSGLFGAHGDAGVALPGLLASVGAGASYALYTLASKQLLTAGWTATGAMGAVFGLAGAASVPLLMLSSPSWLFTAQGIAMALWLGLGTTTVAYILFARGLRRLSAPTVSTLTLAEPLTATLLGVLLLHETIPAVGWTGIAILAAGIGMLAVPARRTAHSQSEH